MRKNFPRFTNLLFPVRDWSGVAIGRRLRRCRVPSRGATSPQLRVGVRSTGTLPVDLVKVATKAGRGPCYKESDSPSPKVAWRGGRASAPAHRSRSRPQSKCIRKSDAVFSEWCNSRKQKATSQYYNGD